MARKNLKTLKDVHKKYCKDNKSKMTYKEFSSIVNGFNILLMEKVKEGHTVYLPERMGTLSILGRKQDLRIDENGDIKGLAPDWVKTKKLWEDNPQAKAEKRLMYHTNEHSDNTIYKYFWSKNNVAVRNKSLYALRVTRENKRDVHQLIKDGKEYSNRR